MKTIWQQTIVIGCVLFIATQGAASDVTGTVKDVCGRVLPGTAVTVANQAGTAAKAFAKGEGRYSIPALAPGSWTITFMLVGFQTTREEIRLEEGDTVEHSVRLLPDPMLKEELWVEGGDPNVRYRKYWIQGVVTGRSGESVSGATIRLRDVGSSDHVGTGFCTSDELGRFVVSAWSGTATRWRLSIEADGYRPYRHPDLVLTPDEPRAINIRLQPR